MKVATKPNKSEPSAAFRIDPSAQYSRDELYLLDGLRGIRGLRETIWETVRSRGDEHPWMKGRRGIG